MRAFVALVPPAKALAELAEAVAPLRAVHPDLRWTPAVQWHLTLAFLGEIDEGVLSPLSERLSRAARRHPPLSLVLAGGGRFGDRVLWTRVRGEVDRVGRLATSVAAAGRRCRIAVDDRPFRPHLTLARGRDGTDLRPAVAALDGFAGSAWTADTVRLVSSRLGAGPGGTAVHEVVAAWPLDGEPARRPSSRRGR